MDDPTFVPFDADGGLLLATRLPGDAADFAANRRTWEALATPREGGPLWIHLDRTRPAAQRWVREQSGLDEISAESLLAEETRPRVHAMEHGLLLILRGINANPGAEPDELIAIRVWIEPHRVITLRQFRSRTIVGLRVRAQHGSAPATSGAFLAAVASGLSEHIAPSVQNLEERLDDIEEQMLARDQDDDRWRSDLAAIRRQAIAYRRHLVPQRDALDALVNGSSPLLSARDQAELRVAREHTARATEALEELRDRAAVTQEEIRARHESRIGRTVYLLTIVATVALPLGLLTGLLGVNVGGIPLTDSPWGFAVVCGVLALVAVGQVVLFRRMRWL